MTARPSTKRNSSSFTRDMWETHAYSVWLATRQEMEHIVALQVLTAREQHIIDQLRRDVPPEHLAELYGLDGPNAVLQLVREAGARIGREIEKRAPTRG